MSNSESNPIDSSRHLLALGAELNAKAGDRWSMVASQAGEEDIDENNPFDIGAKRSWVPPLGEIVWEIPKQLESRAYYAYTCRARDDRQIGYVRVPNYNYNPDAVGIFGEEIIPRFESATAAMVFDQINNRGGSMFQMYALLGMLTDRALALPQHKITIDEDYAALAADIVADAEAGEAVPSERVAYARLVLSEKAAGRGTGNAPSNPLYLEGVAQILPATIHYTKKIVVLINELTFSAGEFLGAILQDNKRATLFGVRTAGAGGCMKRYFHHGPVTEFSYTLTWTIARRTNGEYIENKGVQPDVACGLTAEDLRSGYVGYIQSLLATINA